MTVQPTKTVRTLSGLHVTSVTVAKGAWLTEYVLSTRDGETFTAYKEDRGPFRVKSTADGRIEPLTLDQAEAVNFAVSAYQAVLAAVRADLAIDALERQAKATSLARVAALATEHADEFEILLAAEKDDTTPTTSGS